MSDDRTELERARRELVERRKELAALRAITRDLLAGPTDDDRAWLALVVERLLPAFQCPAEIEARLTYGSIGVETAGWSARAALPHTTLHAAIGDDGAIDVLSVRVGSSDVFLAEEQELLDSVADLVRARMRARTHAADLAVTEVRLGTALDAARVGVVEWDLEKSLAWVSSTAAELMGVVGAPNPMPRVDVGAHIHPDDRPELRAILHREPPPGHTSYIEFRVQPPGEPLRWIAAQGRLMPGAEGQPRRRLSILFDVTERHLLEEQFRQAQKMQAVGRLAAGIAHDFNNLLTVVASTGELIADVVPAALDLGEEISALSSVVSRGQALTRQLLAFSRRHATQRSAVDVAALVRDMVPLLRRLAGASMTVLVRAADEALYVYIDAHELEQAVMNLVANARDAMPEGGEILVEAARSVDEPEAVAIRVVDAGVGMDASTQRRIFEPFFTTKSAQYGTGLGLATVQAIVSRARGRVTVESTPGIGSAFTMVLPPSAAPPERPAAVPMATPPGGAERVLLIDSDDEVRRLVSRALEELGYHVHEARDGHEALQLASGETPLDLLICDVQLPGHDGRELFEALTIVRGALPTVFLSAFTADDPTLVAFLSAFRVVEKPFTRATLAGAVRAALDRHENPTRPPSPRAI